MDRICLVPAIGYSTNYLSKTPLMILNLQRRERYTTFKAKDKKNPGQGQEPTFLGQTSRPRTRFFKNMVGKISIIFKRNSLKDIAFR